MSEEAADLVRWVGTPVAAMFGGIVASIVLGDPPLAVALSIGFVVGAVVAVADRRPVAPDATTSRLPGPAEADRPPSPQFSRRPAPTGRPAPPVPAEPAPPRVDNTWWNTPTPPPVTEGASMPRPAPALASYLRQNGSEVRTPQCPRCGGFTIGTRAANSGHNFTCRACGHRWAWAPGAPWPAVRIDPRARR